MPDKDGWGIRWVNTLKPILMFFCVAALAVVAVFGLLLHGHQMGLPSLALGGIVALLASLLVYASLMNYFELSDKTQALGLPEGSVRAIIAMSLVALFAVLSAFIMSDQSDGAHASSILLKDRSAAEVEDIRKTVSDPKNILVYPEPLPAPQPAAAGQPQPATPPQKYSVLISTNPKVPVDDFVKQVMTLVGTLMTAITAFYFGSRAAAPPDVSRAAPVLTELVDPMRGPQTSSFELKLLGSDLNSIRSVRLEDEGSSVQVEAGAITSNAAQVHCMVPPHSAFAKTGSWKITVVDDINRAASKDKALTITAATQTGATTDTPPAPAPTPGQGFTGKVGQEQEITIAGTGLASITRVQAEKEGGGSVNPSPTASADGKTLTFKITPNADGAWKISIGLAEGALIPVGTMTVAAA